MRALTFGWLAASVVLCFGCAKSGPTVTGTVRLDGALLPTGSIRFIPIENTPGPDAGAAINEGNYKIEKGLAVGKYRVEIQSFRPRKDGTKPRDPLIPPDADEKEAAVAREYNLESKLTREVIPGPNTFDFDVKGTKTGK
jgi:hypothetical protein